MNIEQEKGTLSDGKWLVYANISCHFRYAGDVVSAFIGHLDLRISAMNCRRKAAAVAATVAATAAATRETNSETTTENTFLNGACF